MTKFLLVLLLFSFAHAQQTQPPQDINLPANSPALSNDWSWVGGEQAEIELLKMSEDLENGIKGIKILKEVVAFSTWWIFPQDDELYQAPKAMRIQMNHPGHDVTKAPEIAFTIEYKIGRIAVPLLTFSGTLKGISTRNNSTEQYIYLYLKEALIEPSTDESRWGKTASISCEVCDLAKDQLRPYAYRLARYVKDDKFTLAVHFTGKKDDRVGVDVVDRKK